MGSEGFFVVKLRIITSDEDNRRLKKAFDCATQITNATIRTAYSVCDKTPTGV